MQKRNPRPSSVATTVFRHAAIAVCFASLAGCGPSASGPSPVPVTGTLKFKDGTVPHGEIAMIRFEPTSSDGGFPAALANLQSDGSFSLSTADGRKGALPGKYKVTLKIWKTYRPPHVSVVPEKYARIDTSKLDVEVTQIGENRFDLEIDPK